ncbi:MAG: hypothetical protein JST14_03845 [Bacteroidetes bacterium]|nr:hypothetical protein [Bacteroidota bacterium]
MKVGRFSLSWSVLILFLLFVSCNKSMDTFLTEDKQTSNNETTQESTISELDDLATTVLNSSNTSGVISGRTDVTLDDRLNCTGTTIEFSNVSADKTSGTVTITFPSDGCTDKRGNVRKGQIIITWTGGKWFQPGSVQTITMNGYSINGVAIEGTHYVTCVAASTNPISITWTISGEHSAPWPEGTTARRKVNKNSKWDHSDTDDIYAISNGPSGIYSAEGTNRHGRQFKTIITSPLIYLRSCALNNKVFIPVKGQKVVTHISMSGKTRSMTIDFGDGQCENTYLVTCGPVTKTLTAKNDSSAD